ncbi:hypothetical protein V6N13_033441 [Hibiscus sabdariffa]
MPLEVPGNRLPETGSRRTLLHARGAWMTKGMPRIETTGPAKTRSSYWDVQENILMKTQSLFRFLISAREENLGCLFNCPYKSCINASCLQVARKVPQRSTSHGFVGAVLETHDLLDFG